MFEYGLIGFFLFYPSRLAKFPAMKRSKHDTHYLTIPDLDGRWVIMEKQSMMQNDPTFNSHAGPWVPKAQDMYYIPTKESRNRHRRTRKKYLQAITTVPSEGHYIGSSYMCSLIHVELRSRARKFLPIPETMDLPTVHEYIGVTYHPWPVASPLFNPTKVQSGEKSSRRHLAGSFISNQLIQCGQRTSTTIVKSFDVFL